MEQFFQFDLANGIRVIHQELHREVGHCGLLIGAGSRDEQPREHGLAHFLEHCLFKGTRKRKTFHILSRLDAVGGELNAFTAKEETWVHASFLKADYERAIELIADIAFHASFPAAEIEKEKEVIIDEINSYRDSPADMVFEEFDSMFFGSHSLGRSILGTPVSVRAFSHSDLVRFRSRVFDASRILFSSCGPISGEALKTLLERHVGSHSVRGGRIRRVRFAHYQPQDITRRKAIHQVHYVMGFPAYDYSHPLRPALTLLNNILGGPGMNNRLSLAVREKHGLAYHVDSTYAPFSDAGIFSVYLGTDERHLERSLNLIWKEIDRLREKPLSDRSLHEAKRQLCGQIALSNDSGTTRMFSLGKSLLVFNRVDTLEEVFRQIDRITARQLREVACDICDRRKQTSLCYLPES